MTTTIVSECNCTSLELCAAHYDDTQEDVDESELKVIYPIYYALDYWQTSFGFYLTITAGVIYTLCLGIVLFCDQFAKRRVLIKIYEKIRKRELEEGWKDEDSGSDASDESEKSGDSDDDESHGSKSTMHTVNNGDEKEGLKKRSKLKDRDTEKGKYTKVNETTQNMSINHETQDAIEMHDIHNEDTKSINSDNKVRGSKAKSDFLAPHKPNHENERKNTKGSKGSDEEIKSKHNDSQKKKSTGSDNGTNKSEDEFEKNRKEEDRKKELTNYYLTNIFIQGSTLHSFLWIESYINPRHVRGTIFFTYIVLIWYVCAVAYNNMRKPSDVPDFSRKASNLTWGEIWMAYLAPIGATILLYIFTIIMKLSPERIRATRTTKFLDYVITEYGREQVLRYLMGYFIIGAVHFMIFMYIINFTALHGWKIAWRWWYTGSLSFFINILIYDPCIAIIHWLIYR